MAEIGFNGKADLISIIVPLDVKAAYIMQPNKYRLQQSTINKIWWQMFKDLHQVKFSHRKGSLCS